MLVYAAGSGRGEQRSWGEAGQRPEDRWRRRVAGGLAAVQVAKDCLCVAHRRSLAPFRQKRQGFGQSSICEPALMSLFSIPSSKLPPESAVHRGCNLASNSEPRVLCFLGSPGPSTRLFGRTLGLGDKGCQIAVFRSSFRHGFGIAWQLPRQMRGGACETLRSRRARAADCEERGREESSWAVSSRA